MRKPKRLSAGKGIIGLILSLASIVAANWLLMQSQNFGGSSSVSSPGTTFDPTLPANGGVVATVKEVFDATFVNTSTTITTPAADVPCTSSDVGTIVFGTNDSPGQGHIGATVVVPQGTIVSCTAHSIVVSVAATANCTPSGGVGCRLLWGGTVQTTSASTAFAKAATANTGTSGVCPVILWPNGLMFIDANPFTAAITCRDSNTGTTTTGLVHRGWGRYNTQFVFLPSFNWATCTSGADGKNCLGAANGVQWVDIGFTGGGNALVGGSHAVNIIELQTDGLADHILCEGIGANDAAMVGLQFSNFGEGAIYPIFDGCGGLGADVASGVGAGIKFGFFGDSVGIGKVFATGCGVMVEATGILISQNSGYGPCGTGISFGAMNAGTWNSDQDQCNTYFTVNAGCIATGGTSVTNLNQWTNAVGSQGNTNNPGIVITSTTSKVFLEESRVTSGSAGTSLSCTANGLIFDLGGNDISTSGTQTSCPAASFFGTASITGTNLVAGNVVLSAGWGTTATVTAPAGGSRSFTFTANSSGTGQAANPTMAITFPKAFWVAPPSFTCKQVGGTQAISQISGENTATATTMTLTYNGTPTAGLTVIVNCGQP